MFPSKSKTASALRGHAGYDSRLYDQPNTQLSLKIRLLEEEAEEAKLTDVLHGRYALRTVCSTSFCCDLVGFRKKGRDEAARLVRAGLCSKMINLETIETTIRKRQLWFAEGPRPAGRNAYSKLHYIRTPRSPRPRVAGWPSNHWTCVYKGLFRTKESDGNGPFMEWGSTTHTNE